MSKRKFASVRERPTAEDTFAELCESLDPDEFTTIRNLSLSDPQSGKDCEVDVVIIYRNIVVAIEIKGGDPIYYDAGTWWSGKNKIQSPAKQAIEAGHILYRVLSKRCDVSLVRVMWLVAFPEASAPRVLPPEVWPIHILDIGDNHSLADVLDARLRTLAGKIPFNVASLPDEKRIEILNALLPAREVNSSLREYFNSKNRIITHLTIEQAARLQAAQKWKRAFVAGCAGSGKTLMALQRATSQRPSPTESVLILCHSQPLAYWMRTTLSAIKRTDIVCVSFGQWIAELVNPGEPMSGTWTRFDAPSDADILAALDVLSADADKRYSLVIVDEGQDFEEDWWDVVTAAVKGTSPDGSSGQLVVFFDDNQRLHLGNAIQRFLSTQEALDLSRNCRNAARIFDVVAATHPSGAELTRDPQLGGKGTTLKYESFTQGEETRAIGRAIQSLVDYHGFKFSEITVLIDLEGRADCDFSLPPTWRWQDEIGYALGLSETTTTTVEVDPRFFPSHIVDSSRPQSRVFQPLSSSIYPSQGDIECVRDCAKARLAARGSPATISHADMSAIRSLNWPVGCRPRVLVPTIRGRPQLPSPAVPYNTLLKLFVSGIWVESLPMSSRVVSGRTRLGVRGESGGRDGGEGILISDVASFKGLESDAIILVVRGAVPHQQLQKMLYVGASRARLALWILATESVYHDVVKVARLR